MLLLWDAGAYFFSAISGTLLIAQFLVVYVRVLPYLQSTYGSDSAIYLGFLYGGCPFGSA